MNKPMRSFAILCAAVVLLASCAGKKDQTQPAGEAKTWKIGISKIVAHPALDATEKGIQDELAARGISATWDLQNANGDVNTATQIASKFKSEGADIIVAIATPTAVAAANAIKDRPVIFSVITDPVGAGLVDSLERGRDNVTGVSDMVNVLANMTLFANVAKVKTVGYIYTSSEANSASSLADIEKACEKLGLKLIPQSINNSSEVKQATEAIIGRVDGIYLSTDNTVFSALPALVAVALANKKPIFSSDTTSAMEGGCLIASGFDYYKAGRATGSMVADVIGGKKPADIPVKLLSPSEGDLLLDLDVAKACGIEIPADVLAQASKIIENGKLTSRQ